MSLWSWEKSKLPMKPNTQPLEEEAENLERAEQGSQGKSCPHIFRCSRRRIGVQSRPSGDKRRLDGGESRPAVPTSVINKFVIANVRWRVDAEFELQRRHDERAGARAPGIHLVVTARERDTRTSSQVLLS